MRKQNDWTKGAAELTGPRFVEFQIGHAKYNAARFKPGLPEDTSSHQLTRESRIAAAEITFVEALREAIAPWTADISSNVDRFIEWFEGLKETSPAQGDPLFPWLATEVTVEQMTWFLLQEVAGEAGSVTFAQTPNGLRSVGDNPLTHQR